MGAWDRVSGSCLSSGGAGAVVCGGRFFQASGAPAEPWGAPTEFVVQPPYTWTRNPMYLGVVTVLLGMAIFFESIAMLLAPAVFFAVTDRMVIPREEETMERLFGQDYRNYTNRVRRWI